MYRSLRPAKPFAWTLIIALMGLILAACGGTTTPPAASTAAPSTAASVAASEAAPSVEASASAAASPSEAASASASASAEASASGAATGSPPPAAQSPINDKVFVAGFNQAPDTLFGAESQSSVTVNVLAATGKCITSLKYDYQPTYCFKDFPTFQNGQAVTQTVTIDPSKISAENPIVVEGTLVTDTAAAEAAGIKIPTSLAQLTLTWKLANDLYWEDGQQVTSADYAETFRVQKDPALQLATRYLIDRVLKVDTPDQFTAVQTYAPGYLDNTYFTDFLGLTPAHKYKGQTIEQIRNAESTHPFSFGPYVVKEHVPQSQTTLVSNPYFKTQPKIGTVIFKYVADADQLLSQLESGEVDYAGTIGLGLNQTEQLNTLQQNGKATAQFVPATVWEHIDFGIKRADGQPSFFDDVKVRQAVAYAVNRQQIIDQVLFGKTTVMNTYVPKDHPSYPGDAQLEQYQFDQNKAKQLLSDAGWKAGSDGILAKGGRKFSVTMYTTQGNRLRQAASEIIQQNLKQVGIELKLEYVPGPEVLFKSGADGILAGRRFDMALYAWVSGPDASHLLYTCDQIPTAENGFSGQNNPAYCNPEFDVAAKKALGELDRNKKKELDKAPEIIWNKDLPALPLYQRLNIGAFVPGVTGIQLDPTSDVDLYNLQDIDINK